MLSKLHTKLKSWASPWFVKQSAPYQTPDTISYNALKRINDELEFSTYLSIATINRLIKEHSTKKTIGITYSTIKTVNHKDSNTITTSLTNYSRKGWQEFISSLSDSVTITVGYRAAFLAQSPIPLTHLVLVVSDSTRKIAIFGFNSKTINSYHIQNDSRNQFTHYTLYKELCIVGTQKQALLLFESMEQRSQTIRFDGIFHNCYTPVITALIQSKAMGFTIPKQYKKNLLIVIPTEQNKGCGILYNAILYKEVKHSMEKITNQTLPETNYSYFAQVITHSVITRKLVYLAVILLLLYAYKNTPTTSIDEVDSILDMEHQSRKKHDSKISF